MTPFTKQAGYGLRWLGSNAVRLHGVGWALFAGSIFASCTVPTDVGDWTFRYPPDMVINRVGRLVLCAAVVASVVSLVLFPRVWNLLLLLPAGLFLLLLPPRWPFSDGALSRVCGETAGCYYLTVAPVFTDTVYDVWHASTPGGLIWHRLEPDQSINYSEDGSYRSDPRIFLSGNERILVLARGDYLVDAIDLRAKRRLSEFIFWNEPDRDARMRTNSDRIEALLAENR